MSDETRRRLEEAGSRPVPPPDPAFAERARGPPARGRRDVAGRARARPARVRSPVRRRRSIGARRRGARAPLAVRPGARARDPARPTRPGAAARAAGQRRGRAGRRHACSRIPTGSACPRAPWSRSAPAGTRASGTRSCMPGDVATIERGGPASSTTARSASVTQTPGRATRGRRRPDARGPSPAPDRTPRPTAAADPQAHAPSRRPLRIARRSRPRRRTDAHAPTAGRDGPAAHAPRRRPCRSRARPRLRAHANPAGDRVVLRWTATRRAASYLLIVTRSRSRARRRTPCTRARACSAQFAAAPDRWLRFRVLDPVVEVKADGRRPGRRTATRSRAAGSSPVTTGGDVTGEVPADPDPPPDDGGAVALTPVPAAPDPLAAPRPTPRAGPAV